MLKIFNELHRKSERSRSTKWSLMLPSMRMQMDLINKNAQTLRQYNPPCLSTEFDTDCTLALKIMGTIPYIESILTMICFEGKH